MTLDTEVQSLRQVPMFREIDPARLKLLAFTSERVQFAVGLLSDMKQASQILKACEDIDRLESEADRVLRAAISKLFREEDNVKTLIKLKAIFELLETITDKCEDVANIIEGIVLENA